MADYASLKVAELKKLLGEKGLSDKGLKPELVARLKEHDAGNGETKPAESKDDEITYSDDEGAAPAATAAPSESASAPAPAAAPAAPAAPADSATEAPVVDAAKTDDAPAPAEEKPAVNYAMGLSTTAADDEAKRRADRAKRFGIEEDEEAKLKAERAKRFGIDEKELATGLDSALPERSLKRGRGRQEGEGGSGRPGKRQSLDRRGGRQRDERRGGGEGGGGAAKSVLMDPTEKAKAEKRAARFAAA